MGGPEYTVVVVVDVVVVLLDVVVLVVVESAMVDGVAAASRVPEDPEQAASAPAHARAATLAEIRRAVGQLMPTFWPTM
ncbi:MAG: hypothetical protein RLZ86_701 [Actinomycetota bacterium]